MKLELGIISVNDVRFGSRTEFQDGVVYINKDELLKQLHDQRLIKLDLEIARPGDPVRICPVKDVLEPRVKVQGPGHVFPGYFGNTEAVGSGRTHVLKGMAVVTVGQLVGFQEGIVDMCGPGAEYTPFSKTINVVVWGDKAEGLKPHEHEEALRYAGLKATRYIAEAARYAEPQEIQTYETFSIPDQISRFSQLPRVAYVYMLQTQGLMHDTYVYGVDAKQILPTIVDPTEVMDGAIISGNCVSACDKNTTYHHMNNPVINDLMARHGRELNFVGVVITNEKVTLLDKERSSNLCTRLVSRLGVDGVIISEEGFGNPDADLIMNCRKIEALGIKTVLITDEYAGRDGASQSLADSDKAGNAVVSSGNANELVTLPPMEKTIGHLNTVDLIAGGFNGSLEQNGSITVELQAITGATNELGFNRLGAVGI